MQRTARGAEPVRATSPALQLSSAFSQRGAKAQPLGRLSTTGGRPGDGGQFASPAAQFRHAGDQAFGVGMGGRIEHRMGRTFLDDPACVHHRHAVAKLRDNAEIMGDEDDRQPPVTAEVAQQRQDLRLHGDIEGGCGFVRDDHVRLVRKRHGDADALTHPTGHLMRVIVDTGLGIGDAHVLQKLDGAGLGLGSADLVM